MYRCRVVLLPAFIQQLSVAYVANGYRFYVKGRIRGNKDPAAVDRKLIERYRIDISKWQRARRKREGLANLHYLRHGRLFVLIASHGWHPFFEHEEKVLRDIRRVPLKHGGYSVSFRNEHASVRIDQEMYKGLKSYLVDLAVRRSLEHMMEEFRMLPYEPYAPIRRQLLNLLRAVNRARKQAGYEPVPTSCLRLKRRIYRPFEDTYLDEP